jgi:TonB family protein
MAEYHQIGKYVLLKELPETPLGRNFRAAELGPTGLNRIVHLTRLIDEVTPEVRFQQILQSRFINMRELLHEGIIKPLEVSNLTGVFISQEYVEGVSLKAVINRCVKNQLPFSADYTIYTAAKLCNTLEYAHSNMLGNLPLIHGGLNPYNIYFTFTGDVKIVDWNIVAAADSMSNARNVFLQRYQLYLSPEQMEGQPSGMSTDIFQIGLIFYEMLTGSPLFTINRQEKIDDMVQALYTSQKTIDGQPIPDEIINIVSKALAVNPVLRYPSMKAMREDLDTLLYSGTYLATPTKTSFFLNSVYKEEIKILSANLNRERNMNYSPYLSDIAEKALAHTGEAEEISVEEISAQILPEAGEILVEDEEIYTEVDDQFITYTRRKKSPIMPYIIGGASVIFAVLLTLLLVGQQEPEIRTVSRPEDIVKAREYNDALSKLQQLEAQITQNEAERTAAEERLKQLEADRQKATREQTALEDEQRRIALLQEQQKLLQEQVDREKKEKERKDAEEKERLAKMAATLDSASTPATTTARPTTTLTSTLTTSSPAGNPTAARTTATGTTSTGTPGASTSPNLPVVVPGNDPDLVMETISKEPPRYPSALRRTGIRKRGMVRLIVLVGTNGEPESVKVLTGDKVFHTEAVRTVSRWRWTPPKRKGQPVKVSLVVAVNF